MKIPLSLVLLGMAGVAAVSAWVAAGPGRIQELTDFEQQRAVRPEVRERQAALARKPESYLVFGILPPEITAVTYDAWQFGSQFVVMRTLDVAGARPSREEAAFKSGFFKNQLGKITSVNFVSMRDDYFVPGLLVGCRPPPPEDLSPGPPGRRGVRPAPGPPGRRGVKAAPIPGDGSALKDWLADGVDTYAPLVGGFRTIDRSVRDFEDREVFLAEVSYHSEKDNLDMKAIFATWASPQSGNAYLLFAMTAPEFTPDDALDLVLKEICILSDDIDLPPRELGDPLRGLNISKAYKKSIKDGNTGNTVSIPWHF